VKAAKKLLDSGDIADSHKPGFVCTTIWQTNTNKKVRNAILKWIDKQLDGRSFVTTWAKLQGVKLETHQEYQAYRHAWVDHMIKVLES
jgi:hypothetical protein